MKKLPEGRTNCATCEKCGLPVFEGDWPFCASETNPLGHSRGTYGFKMSSVLAKKWERMS